LPDFPTGLCYFQTLSYHQTTVLAILTSRVVDPATSPVRSAEVLDVVEPDALPEEVDGLAS
jgi:hypothetical protein